jgi:very-short-patch-repair endonuclease
MRGPSSLEQKLAFQMRAVGLPAPHREYRFVPGRMYRADFAFVEQKLLVEAEGGLFSKGKGWHLSVGGFLDDLEKYNLAALLGYRVLRFTAKEIGTGKAVQQIEQALKGGVQIPMQKEIEGLGLRAEGMGS